MVARFWSAPRKAFLKWTAIYNYVRGVSDSLLVVVGLVGHGRAIAGGLNDLLADDISVLAQRDEDLVAVNVYGLDGQLVALFQLEGRAGGDGLSRCRHPSGP